jgi:hypothetical protein
LEPYSLIGEVVDFGDDELRKEKLDEVPYVGVEGFVLRRTNQDEFSDSDVSERELKWDSSITQ